MMSRTHRQYLALEADLEAAKRANRDLEQRLTVIQADATAAREALVAKLVRLREQLRTRVAQHHVLCSCDDCHALHE